MTPRPRRQGYRPALQPPAGSGKSPASFLGRGRVPDETLNTYREGPDEDGHFGMFGGRYPLPRP